jgi:uncharacterized membrane protein YedE/YeeE
MKKKAAAIAKASEAPFIFWTTLAVGSVLGMGALLHLVGVIP